MPGYAGGAWLHSLVFPSLPSMTLRANGHKCGRIYSIHIGKMVGGVISRRRDSTFGEFFSKRRNVSLLHVSIVKLLIFDIG